MKARSIHALLASVSLLALACGGSPPGGQGGSDNGGAATGGGGTGTATGACYHASDYQCGQVTGTASDAEQWKEVCTAAGDTASDTCPTDGLIGCCKTATSSACFYMGIDMDQTMLMESCGPQMATWSTTP